MPTYRAPGVYLKEVSLSPPSVSEVETAVPVFIGYTEKVDVKGISQLNRPTRISSLLDFTQRFGQGPEVRVKSLSLTSSGTVMTVQLRARPHLHDSLRLFYANGGGSCTVVSVGSLDNTGGVVDKGRLLAGLDVVRKLDEPTLLVVPDAIQLEGTDLYEVQQAVLKQCADLGDRFGILDLRESKPGASAFGWKEGVAEFRDKIGTRNLKHGAAYTPHLVTRHLPVVNYRTLQAELHDLNTFTSDPAVHSLIDKLAAAVAETDAILEVAASPGKALESARRREAKLEARLQEQFPVYDNIVRRVCEAARIIPPSGAIAGVFAKVDRERGVWKAPANIPLNEVAALTKTVSRMEQRSLTIDPIAGKSINAIRKFPGKGVVVWGARTLAGNDNEWRYIPVRRFFNMIGESLRQSLRWAVFEPNDANLWAKVEAIIESYLTRKWREGALSGAQPRQAFFVKVGLGTSMTQQDIVEGRLVVDIGMALVRPAEFIILRVTLKMRQP